MSFNRLLTKTALISPYKSCAVFARLGTSIANHLFGNDHSALFKYIK